MKFELPQLPYPKDALAPHVSARTVDVHYEKHHRGYLSKLKRVLGDTPRAELELEEIIRTSEGPEFNFAAQVWNHTFYWQSMTPKGGGAPEGELAEALRAAFGGVDAFKRTFAEAATGEFGSGWAWLVATPQDQLLAISSSDADNPLRGRNTPLLALDVWEHAYYLDYQNERGRYVEGFLDHLINWEFAACNFVRARATHADDPSETATA